MAKYKVLCTKKLDPSLVEQAKQHSIEIIEQEFIAVKPVWNQATFNGLTGFSKNKSLNIVVTSANAVDALKSFAGATPDISEWNIFCLSGKTLETVLNAGFQGKHIVAEAANASQLAQKIIEAGVKEIIFFCGNKRRDELPKALKGAGIKVFETIVYETIETPLTLGIDIDAVLFFSPSGVQSFFSSNVLKNNSVCFAIGPTTAATIAGFTKNETITIRDPHPRLLMEQVIEHFKQRSIAE